MNASTSSEHPFAPYVRTLGRGKTGTRSLSLEEAQAAMGMILRGEVEPLQLGAFLMLLRVKEETGAELAGFVLACRDFMQQPPAALQVDLDWSSYAGKRHQHPWYILSQLLLAGAGYTILVHGSRGHTAQRLYTQDAYEALGLPVADGWSAAEQQLSARRLSYLPLDAFCAPLQGLVDLKWQLGLRSPVNTLTRMLNPLRARASIQSVFHPAYAALHQAADQILGQPNSLVLKGESGEVEVRPHADALLTGLRDAKPVAVTLGRELTERPEPVAAPDVSPLQRLWHGGQDDYGLRATLLTTAVCLHLLGGESLADCQQQAQQLWQSRKPEALPVCP